MIYVTRPILPKLEEYIEYLKKIWASRWLTNHGELVNLLEKKLQDYLKVDNLILVTNGTLALQLVLKAFELEGEVITTPFTFPATTNVILWEKLKPVFADIDSQTYNIDPEDVKRKITKRTCAILPVHVYGNPCNVEALEKIADKYNLKLIYDAAHAFAVDYKLGSVLNYGTASILSFHATKTFNTIEGGAIVSKDEALLKKLKLLRDFGIESEKKEIERVLIPGINAKMNEFQAAMGLCNLKNIDEYIEKRKRIYLRYKQGLANQNISFQRLLAEKYNYTYMPICFESKEKRDKIFEVLIKNEIKPRKYFYPLTTDSDYFKKQGLNLSEKYGLKNANYVADRILCLPLYPDLEMESVDRIIEIIKENL